MNKWRHLWQRRRLQKNLQERRQERHTRKLSRGLRPRGPSVMEAVVDTSGFPGPSDEVKSKAAGLPLSSSQTLYQLPSDALQAVREDFLYWTGKLSETSLQLSYA